MDSSRKTKENKSHSETEMMAMICAEKGGRAALSESEESGRSGNSTGDAHQTQVT